MLKKDVSKLAIRGFQMIADCVRNNRNLFAFSLKQRYSFLTNNRASQKIKKKEAFTSKRLRPFQFKNRKTASDSPTSSTKYILNVLYLFLYPRRFAPL